MGEIIFIWRSWVPPVGPGDYLWACFSTLTSNISKTVEARNILYWKYNWCWHWLWIQLVPRFYDVVVGSQEGSKVGCYNSGRENFRHFDRFTLFLALSDFRTFWAIFLLIKINFVRYINVYSIYANRVNLKFKKYNQFVNYVLIQ